METGKKNEISNTSLFKKKVGFTFAVFVVVHESSTKRAGAIISAFIIGACILTATIVWLSAFIDICEGKQKVTPLSGHEGHFRFCRKLSLCLCVFFP